MLPKLAPIHRAEELAHDFAGFAVEGIADKFIAVELEDALLRRVDAAVVRRDLFADDLRLRAAIPSPISRQCFFISSIVCMFSFKSLVE